MGQKGSWLGTTRPRLSLRDHSALACYTRHPCLQLQRSAPLILLRLRQGQPETADFEMSTAWRCHCQRILSRSGLGCIVMSRSILAKVPRCPIWRFSIPGHNSSNRDLPPQPPAQASSGRNHKLDRFFSQISLRLRPSPKAWSLSWSGKEASILCVMALNSTTIPLHSHFQRSP